MEIQVFNSYSKVYGQVTSDADAMIRQLLTYKNEIDGEKGQLFFQLKKAKRFGNQRQYHAILAKIKHLEATEYVCLYKDNVFPTGLLNLVLEGLRALNINFKLNDFREVPTPTALVRWNNKPFDPRYYQDFMIKAGLDSGRGIFESAVGTGKSLIMAYLVQALQVESLIIVPSVGLSGQLYNDFCIWFGHRNVELLDAAKIRKMKSPRLVGIVTVQSLASLKKSGEFKAFIDKYKAIHVDEIHHSGASSYTDLLPDMDHIYHRYGYTGTFLRNDNKTLEMWGFMSNVIGRYSALQAIKDGFLTPMECVIHQLTGKAFKKYPKEYEANYCGNPDLLQRIYEITNSVGTGSQVLILVKQKDKSGAVIHEYLKMHGIEAAYISGDNSKDEINQTIELFNDKKIRVLIGSSVIGEGIDIRSTDHLIMAQGGKSEIAIVQAIGRLIRLFPGKFVGTLHDFQFLETNYMEKHFDERQEIYQRNFECPVRYAA